MDIGNYTLKSTNELKYAAKEQLRNNWLNAIIICIICWLFTGFLSNLSDGKDVISSLPFVTVNLDLPFNDNSKLFKSFELISFLIGGSLTLGLSAFFLNLSRNQCADLNNLAYGFEHFLKAFLLQLLTTLFIMLWTLLLIIPGVIASLKYSMSYYVMIDNPELSSIDAINLSKEMMYGHKSRLFSFIISFIGWFLLGIITCGIAFIWVAPYYEASKANFYKDLKEVYKGSSTINS